MVIKVCLAGKFSGIYLGLTASSHITGVFMIATSDTVRASLAAAHEAGPMLLSHVIWDQCYRTDQQTKVIPSL